MTWTRDLRQTLPREEIPAFLQDLQQLVKALRDEAEDWETRLTGPLRAEPELVLGYLQEGKKRERVRQALAA